MDFLQYFQDHLWISGFLFALVGACGVVASLFAKRSDDLRKAAEADQAIAGKAAATRDAIKKLRLDRSTAEAEIGLIRIQKANEKLRLHGVFKRACATEKVRMAGQGVVLRKEAWESAPLLAKLKEEDRITLELHDAEYRHRQKLARIDAEIEILKEQLIGTNQTKNIAA